MIKRFALVLLVSSLALPALAEADRAPTKRERAGVAKSAHVPARCLKVRISTVDRRYASAYRRNLRRSCRRYQADGVAVFKKRKGGRWKFLVAGSAFECPVPRVPRAVARDFDISCDR